MIHFVCLKFKFSFAVDMDGKCSGIDFIVAEVVLLPSVLISLDIFNSIGEYEVFFILLFVHLSQMIYKWHGSIMFAAAYLFLNLLAKTN